MAATFLLGAWGITFSEAQGGQGCDWTKERG